MYRFYYDIWLLEKNVFCPWTTFLPEILLPRPHSRKTIGDILRRISDLWCEIPEARIKTKRFIRLNKIAE